METQDMGIVGGGVLVSIGAAYWANMQGLAAGDLGFTGLLSVLSVLVILAGAGFAYLARDFYGGEIGRALEVTAAGFLIYGVFWFPHKIGWHNTRDWFATGTPAWAGIIEPAWQTFFHLLTVITLGIVAYGFYLFWGSEEV